MSDQFQLARVALPDGRGDVLIVRAGHRGTEHVIPPAGPDYAFDRENYAREVQISVSRTGRSVRVFVDGEEAKR